MRIAVLLFLSIIIGSCGASVKSSFQNTGKPLTVDDRVAFLDINHIVPDNAKKLGTAKFGDSGFSTDCDFNSNLVKARKIARQNGANIVKVTEKKTPDLWSTCYRIKVDFYLYEGNVASLRQYRLQID
ncbi:hypothetical protein [Niabella hirudinis]|uniref:hypothetical protein n=1 Tax=Niabella hirudinis TaxID=1285929 RepID=UPI003EB8C5E7